MKAIGKVDYVSHKYWCIYSEFLEYSNFIDKTLAHSCLEAAFPGGVGGTVPSTSSTFIKFTNSLCIICLGKSHDY